MKTMVFVLGNGNSTNVYHKKGCRCLREHGPYYKLPLAWLNLRACGYCGKK